MPRVTRQALREQGPGPILYVTRSPTGALQAGLFQLVRVSRTASWARELTAQSDFTQAVEGSRKGAPRCAFVKRGQWH